MNFLKFPFLSFRDENGQDATDWEVVHKFREEVEERVEDFQSARKRRNMPDIPARIGLQLMGWESKQPIEKVLEYFKLDFEHAKQPELVSLYQLFSRGKDFFVSDTRGVWSLYKDLYQPLIRHILMQRTVHNITYSANSVEVHTENNETFVSSYALCTFSTGVLASDMVAFNPPLPVWKKEAIYKNPMSVYTKIFLKFPVKFWDDHEYILYASKQRGYFPVFQNLDRPGILPNGSNILLVTVTGDEGRRIEEQTDSETKADIMKPLRRLYGGSIPDPIGTVEMKTCVGVNRRVEPWSNGACWSMIVDDSQNYHLLSSTFMQRGQTGKTIINYHEEFS